MMWSLLNIREAVSEIASGALQPLGPRASGRGPQGLWLAMTSWDKLSGGEMDEW